MMVSESEIRAELTKSIADPATVERIMDMISEYCRDQESEAASWAVREYEERMD